MGEGKTKKTAKMGISFWWNPKQKSIHVRGNSPKPFILTVRADPSKKRGHPKLFRELAKALKHAGVPAPE